MSNMYEKLKEQARESQKRWEKIEENVKHMRQRYKDGEDFWEDELIECLELMMLNLRPVVDIEKEIVGLENSLVNLEKVLGKSK